MTGKVEAITSYLVISGTVILKLWCDQNYQVGLIKHNSRAGLPAFDLVALGRGSKIYIASKFQVIPILLIQDHSLRTHCSFRGMWGFLCLWGLILLMYSEFQRQGSSGDIWLQYQLLRSWELEKANTEENGEGEGQVLSGIQPGKLPEGRAKW